MIATLVTPAGVSNGDDWDENLRFWGVFSPVFVASPASEQGLELDFGDAQRCKEQNGFFTLLHPQFKLHSERGERFKTCPHTPKFPYLSVHK